MLTFIFPGQYSSSDPEHIARSQKIFRLSSGEEGISSTPKGSDQGEITASEEKGESKTATSASIVVEPTVPTGNDVVDFPQSLRRQLSPQESTSVSAPEQSLL